MTTKKLILQPHKQCFFCAKTVGLHHHEIFYGSANRKKSIEWGMQVWLCPDHHNMSNMGVHLNKHMDLILKRYGQKVFEETYGHDKFMEVFKRNYLGGDDDGI